MAELPINDVTTFGNASHRGKKMLIWTLAEAPEPNAQRPRPAVKRVLSADGGNLILFTFNAGQSLPDHKAAHPITVQTLRGEVLFTCGGKEVPSGQARSSTCQPMFHTGLTRWNRMAIHRQLCCSQC